jgi:hypothetical protein
MEDIMKQYCLFANIPSQSQLMREEAISDHYHKYCREKDMRGFDYIRMLHESDNLRTKSLCRVIDSYANANTPVNSEIAASIKDKLKEGDRLLMILYPLGEEFHAIVIGWDNDFFVKDPNRERVYTDSDVFNQTERPIYEYLLFEAPQE